MFPTWRMQLYEARRALDQGRLDRACAIVADSELQEFRQTRELSAEIAGRIAERARVHMAAGQTSAGWRDVALAAQVRGDLPALAGIHADYEQTSLARAEQLLASGRTAAAQQELRKLAGRRLGGETRRWMEDVVALVLKAEQQLADGKSAEALQSLAKADLICQENVLDKNSAGKPSKMNQAAASGVGQRIEQLVAQAQQHRRESEQLLEAVESKAWSEVLAAADRLLATAPRDRIARAARRQAWRTVGLDSTHAHRSHGAAQPIISLRPADTNSPSTPTTDTMPGGGPFNQNMANRFMIWVDSVGGYLVCTDDEVVLGQPAPGAAIAVPILADLSRRHAVIRRESGNYTLEPIGEVRVDGRPVTGPIALGGDHEIQLGSAVRVKFTKPHALSATARLTLVSNHRTEPRADAVLLMADSCVLGPKSHSHIACRRWPGDVILFRKGEELCCRATHPITVNGASVEGPAPLELGSRVEGEDFTLSLERV